MTRIQLPLTDPERASLKRNKVKIAEVPEYTADELEVLLNASPARVKELLALAEFQTIASIGIKFAQDLVFIGFYSLAELKGREGSKLTDAYELRKGYRTDPCVEDQFRLVVHFAETRDSSRSWWHFTEERKKYRVENGYPSSRPLKAWHEEIGYKSE